LLRRRGSDERSSVAGDYKNVIIVINFIIIIIIIIISLKDNLYSINIKKKRRRSLLGTEVTYRAEIILNCRIYEYKIYRRPVCKYF